MTDTRYTWRRTEPWAVFIAVAAACWIGSPWSRAGAAELSFAYVRTGPGAFIDVDVALDDQGDSVHRAEVEVHWEAGFTAPAFARDPDCRWHAGDPSFAFARFVPNGCDPGANCNGLAVSTAGAERLPNGPLFSCRIRVPDTAAVGLYSLTFAALSAFGLNGLELPATGDEGLIDVFQAAVVNPGIVVASAGEEATIDVRVTSNVAVASIEHHLTLPPQAHFLDDGAGGVRCRAGSAIGSACLRLFPLPPGCTIGSDCTTVRALVDGSCVGGAIPSGAVTYSCDVAVDLAAPEGQHTIESIVGNASSPTGTPVQLVGSDGTLFVDEATFVTVSAGTAATRPGESASILVSFRTNVDVDTLQHRLTPGPGVRVAAHATGQPRCSSLVPDAESDLVFVPAGCSPGVDCTGLESTMRAGAGATLPRSLLLYRCALDIAADAEPNVYAVQVENITASGPAAAQLPGAQGEDGAVDVREDFAATLLVGSAVGDPGETATVPVSLHTDIGIAGIQNDIVYTSAARIAADQNGRPACRLHPDVDPRPNPLLSAFLPFGCDPASSCGGARLLVLASNDVNPLPELPYLYTCDVAVAANAAPGSYSLDIFNVEAVDTSIELVPVTGTNGSVAVEAPTATPTSTPVATSTPIATATARATSTPARLALGDDGSCSVTPPSPGSGWLLVGLLAVIAVRRRGCPCQ